MEKQTKMEYLLVGDKGLRWNICLLEEQTKDGIFACWRSILKMEYLLVGEAN